ncbi:hypothetical protein STEG23_036042, partial [Scotinomys teguina]
GNDFMSVQFRQAANTMWLGTFSSSAVTSGLLSLRSLIATVTSDTSTDSGCSEATDPGMALSCRLGHDITVSLSSSTDHSDMDASWSSDTNPNSGG